jgi:hypothetical protein
MRNYSNYSISVNHMTILFGDFSTEVGREDIFKLTIRNERVYVVLVMIMDLRVVKCATSERSLIDKSKMFQHCYILKYTWTSDGKT